MGCFFAQKPRFQRIERVFALYSAEIRIFEFSNSDFARLFSARRRPGAEPKKDAARNPEPGAPRRVAAYFCARVFFGAGAKEKTPTKTPTKTTTKNPYQKPLNQPYPNPTTGNP
jgi:hypothetical protein